MVFSQGDFAVRATTLTSAASGSSDISQNAAAVQSDTSQSGTTVQNDTAQSDTSQNTSTVQSDTAQSATTSRSDSATDSGSSSASAESSGADTGITAQSVTEAESASVSVSYSAHVENIGWMDNVRDGATAGTTGKNLRMEAIQISIPGVTGGISYRTRAIDETWGDWVSDGATAGRTGESLREEEIQIKLTDKLNASYNVYYRVHCANLGWLDWVSGGESAGTLGYGYDIQAIEIKVLPKSDTSISTGTGYYARRDVSYAAHVQNIGWQNSVSDGELAGTTGRSLRVEALRMSLTDSPDGTIEYKTRAENGSWQDWASNGETSGSIGKSQPLDALSVRLTGTLAQEYDIYYRVHVSDVGWLGWTSNGSLAGCGGYSRDIEAVEIKILPKGSSSITESEAYVEHADTLTYQSYLQGSGWQDYVSAGEISGSTGKSIPLNAVRFGLSDTSDLNISCQVWNRNTSWRDAGTSGSVCGSTTDGTTLQMIKLNLTGSASSAYDIEYRVHIDDIGWLGWTSNGNSAGSEGYQNIQAIEVKIVAKGTGETSDNACVGLKLNYNSYVEGQGWQGAVENNEISGTTGKNLALQAINIHAAFTGVNEGGIEYRTHVSEEGWMDWTSGDTAAGTPGSNQIEAIEIQLDGTLSLSADVYYRVHISDYGWLGWTMNGGTAGSTGQSLSVQAVQIMIVPKGVTPVTTGNSYLNDDEKALLLNFLNSKIGTPYVYGMWGQVLTLDKYYELQSLYGTSYVWDSDISKVGQVCTDCSGLISWYTGIRRSTTGYYNTATQKIPVSQLTEDQIGWALWLPGHIGIYVGDGYYIAADNSATGVVKKPISNQKWQYALRLPDLKI